MRISARRAFDFVAGGLDGLRVFAANLLLDEGLADELIESALGVRSPCPARAGIEDGEADLVVDVAGQDDVAVDDGDDAVEDDGLGWAVGEDGGQTEEECDQERPVMTGAAELNAMPP